MTVECTDPPKYATSVLAPAPMPKVSALEDWCHKADSVKLLKTYCGRPIPPGEPYCGEFIRPEIGTCESCGRRYCPDCVAAARFGLPKSL